MARFIGVVAVLLGALTLGASLVWSQAIDRKSLIGEWAGTWQSQNGKRTGAYSLTIEKVEGDKVSGQVETTGGRKKSNKFSIQGVLEGNHLKYGSGSQVDLEISGSEMHGRSTGSANWTIMLTRK